MTPIKPHIDFSFSFVVNCLGALQCRVAGIAIPRRLIQKVYSSEHMAAFEVQFYCKFATE